MLFIAFKMQAAEHMMKVKAILNPDQQTKFLEMAGKMKCCDKMQGKCGQKENCKGMEGCKDKGKEKCKGKEGCKEKEMGNCPEHGKKMDQNKK
jgi:hypothetical protein